MVKYFSQEKEFNIEKEKIEKNDVKHILKADKINLLQDIPNAVKGYFLSLNLRKVQFKRDINGKIFFQEKKNSPREQRQLTFKKNGNVIKVCM